MCCLNVHVDIPAQICLNETYCLFPRVWRCSMYPHRRYSLVGMAADKSKITKFVNYGCNMMYFYRITPSWRNSKKGALLLCILGRNGLVSEVQEEMGMGVQIYLKTREEESRH